MPKFKVAATSANLGPGYDTLGLALSLHNKFTVKKRNDNKVKTLIYDKNKEKKIEISAENNLVSRAYKKYFTYISQDLIGADIKEEIKTPIARGLGSSSSAIIAGLAAAALVSGKLISKKEFIQLAVKIEKHPDNVIPALVGGLTINYNYKNSYDYHKIKIDKSLDFIVIVPDFQLKTEDLRKVIPEKIAYQQAVSNLSRISLLTAAFIKKDYKLLKTAMEDKMHQPYRKKLIKNFDQIIAAAYQNGAYGAALSGAGPAVLAVTDKNSEEIANEMKKIFKKNYCKAESYIIKASNASLYQKLEEEIF